MVNANLFPWLHIFILGTELDPILDIGAIVADSGPPSTHSQYN